MTIYSLTSEVTYYRDYEVEAESKEEAIKLVKDGLVDHYDEDLINTEILENNQTLWGLFFWKNFCSSGGISVLGAVLARGWLQAFFHTSSHTKSHTKNHV